MTAKTTRILKEARPLFWPWCAVAMAGALPLVHPLDWGPLIVLIGFFAVPLLATLSFGDEFQHRTFSLLLSQPVGRMDIWGEKLSVTVVAVVSAVLVFSLALRATSFHPDRQLLAFAGAWIVAITASATFWTLFTRSTVGGIALNIGVQSFISFVVPWANLADWLRARGYLLPGNPIVPSTVTFVFLCYAGVMIWLGRRTLTGFQATGGMGSDDLLMAGPDVMPGAFAGWLRCRPTGAVLNLIRKELRLLRPVWLISLLAAVGWACLALFGLLHQRGSSRNFETAVVIVGVISTLIIAILAGSLSLGEERTSGTHSWHMTLPVSALRQWLIKLLMALFAGFVGAGILPMLIAGRLFGSSHSLVDVHLGTGWLLGVLILTFASFWCACAANGTVSAVLWVFPVIFTLGFASDFGGRAGRELIDFVVSRFDPFANLRFANAVASSFDLLAFWRFADHFPRGWESGFGALIQVLALVPAVVFAILQSYRLFRAQLPGRTLSVVRSLLPLAMMAFLCGLGLSAYYFFVFEATQQEIRLTSDIHAAIEIILSSAVNLDATEALHLTVDDLAKAHDRTKTLRLLFSESTRRYLRNSRITVTPNKAHPSDYDYCCDRNGRSTRWWYYLATIPLASGSDLTLSFQPAEDRSKYPRLRTYVQWQGAKGQEEILPNW
jgi:hypothetical protein